MALYPPAEKRLLPVGVNHSSGHMGGIFGVVVHVVVGSLAAADSAFHNPKWKASAHFGVDENGRVFQWVDTHDKAWAEGAGNPNWISIETAGRPETPLTQAQLQAVAAIVRWCADLYHFPIKLANSPTEQGVGTHQMGGAAWGGHACPGPIRAAQRSDIVRLAIGVPTPAPQPGPVPGPAPTAGADDLTYIFQLEGHPHTFVSDGKTSRWHVNANDHNTTVWHLAVNHQDTKVYVENLDLARLKPLIGPAVDPVLLTLGFVRA